MWHAICATERVDVVDVHGWFVTEFDAAGDVVVELGEEGLLAAHVVLGTRLRYYAS